MDGPRDGMGREEGGGFRMGNTRIPVVEIKFNKKKKKKKKRKTNIIIAFICGI